MDDLGFNKIAGAVLATGLGMLILMKLPAVFIDGHDESIAYKVGAIEASSGGDAPIDLPFPQADWVAAMDAAKGVKEFKKCKSCHNVDAGGANGTGPALYDIVGKDKAAIAGFSYSSSLTELGGTWDYEALDAFLKKPSKYAPGTKMSFNGLKKPAQRAAVIEYLRVASPNPVARPEAVLAEPAEEAALEAPAEDLIVETVPSEPTENIPAEPTD